LEWLVFIVAGVLAGIVRSVVEGKGVIVLPHLVVKRGVKCLNLGFLSSAVIGGLAGYAAPYGLGLDTLIAVLAGYVGSHVVEHLVERKLGLPVGR